MEFFLIYELCKGYLILTNLPGKKRFEIACYKNKVVEYREGVETDLDNVLQIPSVFLSVSKGQTAPTEDLKKAFGAKTQLNDIIMEILNKGEMQVGEKERHAQLERVHNEVIDIVAGKLVDPKTKRVYTTGMIDKALDQLSSQGGSAHKHDDAKASGTATPTNGEEGENAKPRPRPMWTGVVTTKSAKSQALDAMKALIAWQPIPVSRARMKLRITCPTSILKQAARVGAKKETTEDGADGEGEKTTGSVKDKILTYVEQVESQDTMGSEWEMIGFVEPGAFKGLGDFLGARTQGRGRMEVLDMAVMHDET